MILIKKYTNNRCEFTNFSFLYSNILGHLLQNVADLIQTYMYIIICETIDQVIAQMII